MKRILHLRTVTGAGGGPEKTLLNSPRFLESEYRLRLAYIRPDQDADYNLPERAARLGVDLVDIPERGALDLRTWRRVAREIRTFRPDLVHAHDYKTNLLAVLLRRVHGGPIVSTLHGYVSHEGPLPLYYRIDRWSLRRMDHIVAVSPDLRDAMVERVGIDADRVTTIANGIDTESIRRRNSTEQAKRRLGLPTDRFVIGAVGRLAEEKAFDHLVRAAAQRMAQGDRLSVVVVGDGPMRARLESQARRTPFAAHFHWVGYQSDPVPYYEAMDGFVLSSLREGLPNVVLEAMALAVPVIATRVAGVQHLLDDGRNGLLIEPGDVPALASAIGRLADDAMLRQSLAVAGRHTVESSYGFDQRMRSMASVYDHVLAGGPALAHGAETIRKLPRSSRRRVSQWN